MALTWIEFAETPKLDIWQQLGAGQKWRFARKVREASVAYAREPAFFLKQCLGSRWYRTDVAGKPLDEASRAIIGKASCRLERWRLCRDSSLYDWVCIVRLYAILLSESYRLHGLKAPRITEYKASPQDQK